MTRLSRNTGTASTPSDDPSSVLARLERAEAAMVAELDSLRCVIRDVRALLQQREAAGPPSDLVTVEQASRYLHASRSRVFQLLAAGELEGVRVGRARCITCRSLDQFLARLQAAWLKRRTAGRRYTKRSTAGTVG